MAYQPMLLDKREVIQSLGWNITIMGAGEIDQLIFCDGAYGTADKANFVLRERK
jgi:hypothetical protein